VSGPDDFDQFYRATVARLTRFVYAYVGENAGTQDLVQDAYARAWQHWGRLRGYDSPEAWLRTVARRLATSRWRRLHRHRAAVDRLGPSAAVAPPGEDVVLLVAALRQLAEPTRSAIVLHHLLDQPVAAVAAELDVPIGTVKARLVRGREQLAVLLGGPSAAGPTRPGPPDRICVTHREVPDVH